MTTQDKLTPAELDEAIRLLSSKGAGTPPCELCQNRTWHIQPHIITPMALGANGGAYFGGEVFPSISIICSNCGNTKLLNVYVLGIRKKEQAPEPPTPLDLTRG